MPEAIILPPLQKQRRVGPPSVSFSFLMYVKHERVECRGREEHLSFISKRTKLMIRSSPSSVGPSPPTRPYSLARGMMIRVDRPVEERHLFSWINGLKKSEIMLQQLWYTATYCLLDSATLIWLMHRAIQVVNNSRLVGESVRLAQRQ